MTFVLHGRGEVSIAPRLPKITTHFRGDVSLLKGAVVLAKGPEGALVERRVWRKFADGSLRDAGA